MTDFPLTADVVLLNSGETARKGMYVEFGLHHEIDGPIRPDDRNPFMDLDQGREKGQRFRVTFHLLADDESTTEIADDETPKPAKPKGGPICKRAVLLCKQSEFQRWIGWHEEYGGWLPISPSHVHRPITEDGAKAYLCRACGIESRAELDHNPPAAATFEKIEREFYDSQQGRTDEDIAVQARSGP